MRLPDIDTVKIYMFHIRSERNAPIGSWTSRQQIFLKLGAQGEEGWGECPIAINNPEVDAIAATKCFETLRGKAVGDAFSMVRSLIGTWPTTFTEAAEMALIDLNGKLTNRSAADILALHGKLPVRGVAVSKYKTPEELRRSIQSACQSRKTSCVRILLTGRPDRDIANITAVREVAPRGKVYLIGDACERYSSRFFSTTEQIGIQLLKLYAAGLDACEDPAHLNANAWITLQSFVSPLTLVADKPLRPARRGYIEAHPRMGRMFNIHPDFAGSIFDAVRLAEKLHTNGNRVYIGDDVCIGPACSAWQQIAIALGADWVEAIEKTKQSDFYQRAKISSGVLYCNGVYNQLQNVRGFGTILDETILSESAAFIIDL